MVFNAKSFLYFLWAAAVFLVGVSIVAFGGGMFWGFEVLAAFRHYYLAAGFILVFTCLFTRAKPLIAVSLMTMVLNGWQVLPVYFSATASAADELFSSEDTLTVLQSNVYYNNKNFDQVAAYIQQTNADVVALQEVVYKFSSLLDKHPALQAQYPYQVIKPRAGMAVLSKYPLENIRTLSVIPEEGWDSVLTTQLNVNGQIATLIVMHPAHPTGEYDTWRQRKVVDRLVANAKELTKPMILVGDLNATPWSHEFYRIKSGLGLKDSRQGFGLQGTWPASLDVGLFRLPIDHGLLSPEIKVMSRTVGPDIGSDHLPVLLKVALPGS